MKYPVLLVVDDDELVIQSVRLCLPEPWRMMACQNPMHLPDGGFHAALVDLHLSGTIERSEGLEVMRRIRDRNPDAEIIAMSGDLNQALMEQCLKAGASRFLAKPLQFAEVSLVLSKIEALLHLRAKPRWIGSSFSSLSIQRQIAQLKGEPGPILLEGESGTGKEVCAELIHKQEKPRPFVVVNVAGIPTNLFESEFFGHVKGAFTGADQNKMGLAEAAHGGDLFLDEVEALSPEIQAKLLRFLENGEARRIGSKETLRINTRVIAATNRNLELMVQQGSFRADLLWRLSGKKIVLPPLRQRPGDIAELVEYFLARDSARRKMVTDEAMQALRTYAWPGNVRELKRVCEHLQLHAPLPLLREQDVMQILRPSAPPTTLPDQVNLEVGLPQLVVNYEAQIIEKALAQKNDIDDVARLLKISRSSLYKKIKDHEIELS